MLVKLADLYEVSVADLLSTPPRSDADAAPPEISREIAEQLSRINEQLVIRNRRARRIWQVVSGILISFAILTLLVVLLFMVMRVSLSEGGTVASEEGSAAIHSSEVILIE